MRVFALSAAALAFACSSSSSTRVRLRLANIAPEWNLSGFEIRATAGSAMRVQESGVATELVIVVPDSWAGRPTRFVVTGHRDLAPYVEGTTTATPVGGGEVTAEVTLARNACLAGRCTLSDAGADAEAGDAGGEERADASTDASEEASTDSGIDVGAFDAGVNDTGSRDAGDLDTGPSDAGVVDARLPPPPRLLAPMSTSIVNRHPSLRWSRAAGTDGVQIHVCADPTCMRSIAVMTSFGGASLEDETVVRHISLPPGPVFWRAYGVVDHPAGFVVGTVPSTTWEMFVTKREAGASSGGSLIDFDLDGLNDVVAGTETAGAVHAFSGASSPSATPAWTHNGHEDWFGHSLANAGDVNGDGLSDLIVGAPGLAVVTAGGAVTEGQAFVALGNRRTLLERDLIRIPSPRPTLDARFGYSVAGLGDVDGDGHGDVAVGMITAPGAYVYRGSATGILPEPSRLNAPTAEMTSFGNSVAGIGDVNGDGFADFAVGDWNFMGSGAVRIYMGARGVVPRDPAMSLVHPFPGMRAASFGAHIGRAGDLNGDGYGDVAIGAELDSRRGTMDGVVYVYYGSPTGLSPSSMTIIESATGEAYGNFGTSTESAGDLDDDGFDELIVGADQVDVAVSDVGAAYVYRGGSAGVVARLPMLLARPLGTVAGSDRFGVSVSGVGDMNGDGRADLAVGAYTTDTETARDVGAVHFYFGPWDVSIPRPSVTMFGVAGGDRVGTSVD